MDSKTLNGKIEVIEAYKNGEQIQMFDSISDKWIDLEMEPEFNFGTTIYRIKPKNKYRPYNSSKEFMDASKEHGPWFGTKDQTIMHLSDRLLFNKGILYIEGYNYNINAECLLDRYFWQDGTRCGIKNND